MRARVKAFGPSGHDDCLIDPLVAQAVAEYSAIVEPHKDHENEISGGNEWLSGLSAERLGSALARYAALHDPLLESRLAHAIISRGIGTIADVLAEFDAEIAMEHANGLPLAQLVRALKVWIDDEEAQLEAALGLNGVEIGGCIVVATSSPWEHAAVHRLLRDHEAPSARVLAGAVPRERLAALYPLAARAQGWALRRANRACGRVQGQHSVAVHVLQKVPLEATGQTAPAAAVAEEGGDGGGDEEEDDNDEPTSSLAELRDQIAARRQSYRAGLTASACKRDSILREL